MRFKKTFALSAIFVLWLAPLLLFAQAPDEDGTEKSTTTIEVQQAPGAMDYRQAGALLAAALGGAGLTWTAKNFGAVKKGNPMKMYATSAVFTFIAGVGAGVAQGLPWRDAAVMAGMGWLAQQGVYKTAKHRPVAG